MNDSEAITKGNGPCQLWHFVGDCVVAPFKVTPGSVTVMQRNQNAAVRREVLWHMFAVIETAKTINRMMGRPEMYGLNEVTR